jgi:hypothetical protein
MMSQYEQTLDEIQADPRYQRNLDWGKPRKGHPEGTVRHHIEELEGNLEKLRPRLSEAETWKLRILIHAHDTFKAEAKKSVPISDPRSHASLARQFLAGHTNDVEMLNIVQLHDEPYALWNKHRSSGDYTARLERLPNTIADWDLFLAFLIVDGCTDGKSRDPLVWFFAQIHGQVDSRVTSEWIIYTGRMNPLGGLDFVY